MVIQIAERMGDREAAAGITTGYFLAFLAVPLLLIFVSTWWFSIAPFAPSTATPPSFGNAMRSTSRR